MTDDRSPSKFVLDSFFAAVNGSGVTAVALSSSRAAMRFDFARSRAQWRMLIPPKREMRQQEKMMAAMLPLRLRSLVAALSVLVAVAVLVVVVAVLVVVVEELLEVVVALVEEDVVDEVVDEVVDVVEVDVVDVEVVELVVDEVVEVVESDVVLVVLVVDSVDVDDVVSRAKIMPRSLSSRISKI